MSGTYNYSTFAFPYVINLIQRSDGVVIPPDPNNVNFAGWQAWIAGGGKPTPVVTPMPLVDATAVLVGGLTITSTSAPALNGTYRTSGIALEGIQAEANALMLGGSTPVFADGSASLNWPDKSGGVHAFTPAQFLELVHAVNYFVSQCAQYAGGAINIAPNATATIA